MGYSLGGGRTSRDIREAERQKTLREAREAAAAAKRARAAQQPEEAGRLERQAERDHLAALPGGAEEQPQAE